MANFNTHISTAFVTSSVTGLMVYKAGILTSMEFLLCSVIGTIGGLLPDIDLGHSVPARIGFHVTSLLMAFLMVMYWVKDMSIIGLLVLWFITYATMRWWVFPWFNRYTVHRGIIHSVPCMAVLSVCLVYISFYGLQYGEVLSWLLGLFLFLGAMVHLLLDEIYSVNLLNLTIKKSFGTAFKFYHQSQPWQYIGLYLLLLGLLIFAPSTTLFWQALTDNTSWLWLKQAFFPAWVYQLFNF